MRQYLEEARGMDRNDPLGVYRDQFTPLEAGMIYLDGNSLGRLTKSTIGHMERLLREEWGGRLIRSWNESWYHKATELGDKIARIAGASPGEIIVADNTSINLFKLAFGALKWNEGRTGIVSDTLNFPSDIYILQGLVHQFGEDYHLDLAPSGDGISVSLETLNSVISDQTALVALSHVIFKSSFMYDMEKVTEIAHEKGALMLWDLSHSIGSVPITLNKLNVDLAVGCTYKYLNGGPGAPAFLYVRKDLQERLLSPIWGWFGQHMPFEFSLRYEPAEGIQRFLSGTPPILSMAAVEPAVSMLLDAGIELLREKSIQQSNFLIKLAEKYLFANEFKLGSPSDFRKRGSHVSLKHPEAYRICKALIDPDTGDGQIIPDFREPDNIRLGLTPLYTTFEDVFKAIQQMHMIVKEKYYMNYSVERSSIT